PLVLCFLQGKTRAEAARQLGCPEGTISSRLARGRERLRRRLGMPVGLGAAVLTAAGLRGEGTAGVLPGPLATAAVPTALCFMSREVPADGTCARVVALAEALLRGMVMAKVKRAAVMALCVFVLAGSAGMLARRASAVSQPEPRAEAKAKHGEAARTEMTLN